MELWIRSQDREKLIKVKSLYVEKYPSSNNRYAIYNFFYDDLDDCDIPLGTYETRERALEVLDEIQDELIGSDFMSMDENEIMTCGSTKVYEMPLE